METYRSGRNENDSKSFCLEIGTWVRIPPSPPRRNGLRSIQKARSLTGLFSYTPSFLLFRKRSRLLRLLACKRAPNLLRMGTGFPLVPHKRLLSNCRGQLIKAGIISSIQHTKPGRHSRSWLFLFAKVWLYSQTVQSVCPCQIEKPFQAGPIEVRIRSC